MLSLKYIFGFFNYKLLVVLVSIACAATGYFLLTRIDLIVHGQLYNFGLIFSAEWADSYRTCMWLVYACLVAPIILSGVALASVFIRKKPIVSIQRRTIEKPQKAAPDSSKVHSKTKISEPRSKISRVTLASSRVPEKVSDVSDVEALLVRDHSNPSKDLKVEVEQEIDHRVGVELGENKNQGGDLIISCPKCKKTFRRPLIMLDFGGPKPRLVNVCPYCSQVLGNSEAEGDVYCDVDVAEKMVRYGDS